MTTQTMDTIFYRGNEFMLAEEPLGSLRPRPRFMAVSTANHRGYTAVFSIVGSCLFLVAASGHLEDGSGGGDALVHFFPDAKAPVLVDWFSGELHLWSGRHVGFADMDPVFENETILTVESGVIMGERTVKHAQQT